MEKRKSALLGILGFVVLLGIDQWTKCLAVTHLKDNAAFPIISGVFELEYLENHGAAFGVLQGQRWFFLIISILILIALAVFYGKMPATKRYMPLRGVCVLLAAGAVGNMIDRLIHGYVIDFLYFKCIQFPIFNIADCYVTVTCFVLLILLFFYYKDEDFSFLRKGKSQE